MFRSDDIKELVAALCKAQGAMEPAKFNKKNPHFKSRYADFTSCMESCRKPLSDNGLSVMQYCETSSDNKLKLVTMLAHVSGQWITSALPLNDLKTCQAFGAEITYMKRYGLSAMLGIVADEDADSDDDGESAMNRQIHTPHQSPYVSPNYITPNQAHFLMGQSMKVTPEQKKSIVDWMKANCKAESFELLTVDRYDSIAGAFERAIKTNEGIK